VNRSKLFIGGLAVLAVATAFRYTVNLRRRTPRARPWLIVASLAGLGLVPLLIPWMYRLSPTMSESPGGLIVVIPKVTFVSLLALGSLGTLIGAIVPVRPGPSDDAA